MSWKAPSSAPGTTTAPRSSPCKPTWYSWTGGGAFWEVGVPEVEEQPFRGAGRQGGDGQWETTTEDRDMTESAGKLAGKVVVISGGTQGLGEAIARQVVADGAAGLVLAGRSADRGTALAAELTELGTPTVFVEVDMTDPQAPRAVIGAADERFGVVHCVVNVAAATWRDNVWTATPQGFEEMIGVNSAPDVHDPSCCGGHAPRGCGRFDRQHRFHQWSRRPAVHPQLLRLRRRAGNDDQEPRVLPDAGQDPGQRDCPGLDGHRIGRRRAAQVPWRSRRLAGECRGRAADGSTHQAAGGCRGGRLLPVRRVRDAHRQHRRLRPVCFHGAGDAPKPSLQETPQ